MGFDELFKGLEGLGVPDVLWKFPEVRGSGGEGPVPQGWVLGSGDGCQEVGVSRSEMVGGGMALGKVIEGFTSLGKEPVELLEG